MTPSADGVVLAIGSGSERAVAPTTTEVEPMTDIPEPADGDRPVRADGSA